MTPSFSTQWGGRGGRGGRGNQMTHVCDAYKIKWDGNNFLKRGHTLLTQSSHQAIYKWETVVTEKKRLAKTQIFTEGWLIDILKPTCSRTLPPPRGNGGERGRVRLHVGYICCRNVMGGGSRMKAGSPKNSPKHLGVGSINVIFIYKKRRDYARCY